MKHFLPATAILILCFSAAFAQRQTTVADNVITVLDVFGLADSIEIVSVNKNYVIARPRLRPDGAVDNRLWETINSSRARGERKWVHDNTAMSWLSRNGTHSYRQASRPSLQAVFSFRDKKVVKIKLDIDRFPPGGNGPMTSARHFFQEMVPNLWLGKRTNQSRISRSLKALYRLGMRHPSDGYELSGPQHAHCY